MCGVRFDRLGQYAHGGVDMPLYLTAVPKFEIHN